MVMMKANMKDIEIYYYKRGAKMFNRKLSSLNGACGAGVIEEIENFIDIYGEYKDDELKKGD